jgi:tripartite-type tricarboxylate transporter receptor subunit TctC
MQLIRLENQAVKGQDSDQNLNRIAPGKTRRRSLLKLSIALSSLLLLHTAQSWAQDADYPNKPIRMTVPYPAGGVVDIVTRVITERMAVTMKQPFIVEAKPGANANIGTDSVLRGAADGYNVLVVAPFLATNPLLTTGTRWKASDFAAIGLIGAPPNVFVVPASSPFKTLREVMDYARSNPNKLNVSIPGTGTSNHLGQELLFSQAKVDLVNIPYKGQPQMIPDIISGQINFGLVTQALAEPHIKAGTLRALAVSAPKRAPALPDIPTVEEAGYPNSSFLPWFGFAAPAATPKAILKRLSDEMQQALAHPEVITKLERMGTQLTPGTAEEFQALIQRENIQWARVIKERNIKAE